MTIIKYITLYYNNIMINYKPFYKTLANSTESTYALIHKHGISSATVDRIRKGGGITTTKIDDLCRILQCSVSDIIEYTPD